MVNRRELRELRGLDEVHLMAALRYVALNPVSAGLVKTKLWPVVESGA